MKTFNAFQLTLLSLVMLICLASCDKDNPFDGLSNEIKDIVPVEVLDSLQSKGMVLNRGNNPPNLDFSIVVSPCLLASPYGPEDPWKKGKVIGDYYYKFYDQNNKGNIKYDFYNNGSSDSGQGLGAFISGDDDGFTIFSEVTGSSFGEDYKSLSIISGNFINDEIVNFQYAFLFTYKSKEEGSSNLIPINAVRLWRDGDGVTPKYTNFDDSRLGKSIEDNLQLGSIVSMSNK